MPEVVERGPIVTVSRVLLLVAVILFVLAAFGVNFSAVGIVPLGLALFAASFLVG